MHAYYDREKKDYNLKFNGTVRDMLKKIKLNPEIVIVVRSGEVLSEDDFVKNSDDIKILSVVSGG